MLLPYASLSWISSGCDGARVGCMSCLGKASSVEKQVAEIVFGSCTWEIVLYGKLCNVCECCLCGNGIV